MRLTIKFCLYSSIGLWLLLLLLPFHVSGQNSNIDSLQQLLTHTEQDSTRILLNAQLAAEFLESDKDSALAIVASAIPLAENISFKAGLFELLQTKGRIHVYHANNDSAIVAFEAAYGIARDLGDLRRSVKILLDLADACNTVNKKRRSIEYLEWSRELAQRLKDNELLFTILNKTGSVYSYLTAYDTSEIFYKKALALQAEIGNRTHESGVLMNLGNNAARANDLDKALTYYQRALELNVDLGDKPWEALIYGQMGYSCFMLGALPSSILYYQSALKIYELENDNSGIVLTYKALSDVYVSMEDYPVALSHIDMAEQFLDENDDFEKLDALLSKSEILLLKEDNEAAFTHLQLGLQITADNRADLPYRLSYYLGAYYNKVDQSDSAVHYFQLAVNDATESNNYHNKVKALSSLGRVYFKLGEIELAIEVLNKAIEAATFSGNLEHEMIASEILYKIYKGKNDNAKALHYFEKHHDLQDSLFNSNIVKQIARIEAQSEFETKIIADSLE